MYMFQIYNFIITAILIIFPFHIISREKDHLFLRILFVYHIIFFILNFYYKGYFASDANGYFFGLKTLIIIKVFYQEQMQLYI